MSFADAIEVLTEFAEAARLGGIRPAVDYTRVLAYQERRRTRWLAAQHTWRSKPGNREKANARERERRRRLRASRRSGKTT